MNDNEAKFLLRAFRPDGRDARDPLFVEALSQAANNPPLRAWLEREQAFDRAVAGKLRDLQPPSGLREAILIGGRASLRRRAWWKNPVWLALAASVAFALTVASRLLRSGPSAHDFAEFAIHELATARNQHGGQKSEHTKLEFRLAGTALPLPGNARVDPEELRRAGCHAVAFAGHEVFEICFVRDGKMFHLYAASSKYFSGGDAIAQSQMMTKGRFTATAWKEAGFTYALVTDEGDAALRKLI